MSGQIYKKVFSVGLGTPSYIIREETKIWAMRTESGKRVLKFEEKIKLSSNDLFLECLIEIEKDKQKATRWETDREMFFRKEWHIGERSKKVKRGRE